jgi:hypothetical protein
MFCILTESANRSECPWGTVPVPVKKKTKKTCHRLLNILHFRNHIPHNTTYPIPKVCQILFLLLKNCKWRLSDNYAFVEFMKMCRTVKNSFSSLVIIRSEEILIWDKWHICGRLTRIFQLVVFFVLFLTLILCQYAAAAL